MGLSPSKPQTKWYKDFAEKLPELTEKTVAITGCTSGTGLVLAKTCADKGAKNILLLNRSSSRASQAEEAVKAQANQDVTQVETIPCDLQDFASVQSAADIIKKKYDAIDILCNNAGVMGLDDYATKDGYDVQAQTNHLSHFLLTKELYPLVQRAAELRGEARIVHHTSVARKGPLLEAKYFGKNGGNLGGNVDSGMLGSSGARWARYQQSKLANAVFNMALADRLRDSKIKAACAAPGLANTNLQTTTHKNGGMKNAMWIMRFSQSAEDGTMPLLAACLSPETNNGDFWEPSGMGRMSGLPKKYTLEAECLDEESKKMLWEKSEEACGKFDCN